MFKYKVTYLTEPASWHIIEESFICFAWSKYSAWKKWLKATKGEPHYTYYEYRHSYWKMRHDIERI